MKKLILLAVFMAVGMLLPSTFAKSNDDTYQQNVETTIHSGAIYDVSVYELKQGSGSVTVKKTIRAKFDDKTNEIIIDGVRYSWSRNPYYGKSEYGKVADYKYTVAGYYFNWEYEGNGHFRNNF